MNEAEQRQERARARERLMAREAQESVERAQARERVRAAQEQERQERQHRATASRQRVEYRAASSPLASRSSPAKETPLAGDAPPLSTDGRGYAATRGDVPTAQGAHAMQYAVMSVDDVIDLFNHPLGDGKMRRALQALAADVTWSCVPDEDDGDRITCVLLHHPSGTTVHVAQERSLVGVWNSRI